MRNALILLAAAMAAGVLLAPPEAHAAAYTVPDHFSTIQEAVSAAADGDTVFVRPGIYYENVVVSAKALTLQSLGGPAQTVVDGQRLGATIRIEGVSNVTLDGFTIQNGGGWGGLHLDNRITPAPLLTVRVNNCLVVNSEPWGIVVDGRPQARVNATVTNTTIANNTGTYGAGIYTVCTNLDLDHVIIANNQASRAGGGLLSGYLSNVTLRNSFVTGNAAGISGGGIAISGPYGGISVFGSVIDRNTAAVSGGGIFFETSFGGYAPGYFAGCTITGNTAPQGAGVYQQQNWLQAWNSIVWGNSSPPVFINPENVLIGYSDFEGAVPAGDGNISADPLFVSTAGRNYQLFAGSPAIDAGIAIDSGLDMLGLSRPQGLAHDMGAYEWTEAIPPVSTAVVSGTVGANGIYTTPATVTIGAEDLYGVREIHYVVNGAETVVAGPAATFALSADGSYDVDWWAVDNYGNAEAAKALPTITVDATAPATVSTSPADGATGVALGASAVVTFSENVAQGGAFSGVALSRDGTPVSATATVSGASITLTPATALASGATYTVTIPAGAVTDAAGTGNATDVVFSFTTVDVTPPAVADTNPVNGATGVAPSANVVITFGEEVAQGPNLAGVVLRRGTKNVAVGRTLSGNTLTLDPTSDLSSSTIYTVTVPAGAVVDTAGNQNAAATTFSFTTAR